MLLFLLKLTVTSLKGGEILCTLCSGWGGVEETAGNILVNFCAQMLENLSSHANTDFWLQQLQASLVAAADNEQSEEHKDDFLFASSCLCYYFSHEHKK